MKETCLYCSNWRMPWDTAKGHFGECIRAMMFVGGHSVCVPTSDTMSCGGFDAVVGAELMKRRNFIAPSMTIDSQAGEA